MTPIQRSKRTRPTKCGKAPSTLPPLVPRDPRRPHCPPPEKVDVRVPDLPRSWTKTWPGKTTGQPQADLFPRLLIRANDSDDGTRPIGGDTGYSPSIMAKAADGTLHQAWMAGESYQVLAVVENQGLATAYNAGVEIYTSIAGRLPGEARLLDSQILDLRPGQVSVVRSRNLWTPTRQAGLPDEAVHILVVHVYDLLEDPLQAPFNPAADRHVGMHVGPLWELLYPEPFAIFDHFPRRLELSWADVGGPYHVEIQRMTRFVEGSPDELPPDLIPVTESLPPGWERFRSWYWVSNGIHGEIDEPQFVWPAFVGAQPGRWRVWSERDPAAKTPWRLFRFEI